VAKVLELEEVWSLLESARGVLSDLRTVSCGHGSPDNKNLSPTDEKQFAADLVEQLVTGTSVRRDWVLDGSDRETFYANQHAKHDALGSNTKLNWNDNLED
jgi:hypothetical protein